jgi:hypothetical protein
MQIPDALLDQVHKLSQRRAREIEETGQIYSLGNQQVRALRDGSTLFFAPSSPVKVGALLSHADLAARLIITSLTEEAGRLAAQFALLPDRVSIYTAAPRGSDLLGRVHYRLTPTNWVGLPAVKLPGKIKLQAAYTPARGDILLCQGEHFLVVSTRPDGPLVEVEVEAW